MPAPIKRVGDLVGDARHLGFILLETVDHGAGVGEQLGAVETKVIGRQGEIRPILLEEMEHPVAKLDVAVAGALCVAQGLNESLVADPVELSRYLFDANVRAHRLPSPPSHVRKPDGLPRGSARPSEWSDR